MRKMTSTNINIGFSETKNSSRVLKPPGGGHSDIFGIKEGNELQTPNKRGTQPPTTITSCFAHEEVTKTTTIENEFVKNEDIKNGNENGTKENVGDENTEPIRKGSEINDEGNENNQQAASSKRVRVPPGGFSSGFW